MSDEEREEILDRWEAAAPGWGRQSERWAEAIEPVSAAMLESAALGPQLRVLELAAGPGDLSRRAAALVAPTNVLCTDGVEAMLEVARELGEEAGITNIAYQRAQLEWIDLPAAAADVILCRFGLMFAVDPEAALREIRRVLAPGGRLVAAVQGPAVDNPWMTAPGDAAEVIGLGAVVLAPGPGPFALAGPGHLTGLLEDTGFFDVTVREVTFTRRFADERDWVGERVNHSAGFAELWRGLEDPERHRLREALIDRAGAYRGEDGSFRVPGRALVASAEA